MEERERVWNKAYKEARQKGKEPMDAVKIAAMERDRFTLTRESENAERIRVGNTGGNSGMLSQGGPEFIDSHLGLGARFESLPGLAVCSLKAAGGNYHERKIGKYIGN